jgi:hypothetical protein
MLAVTIGEIFRRGGGFRTLTEDPGKLLTLEQDAKILFEGSGAGPIFVGALSGLLLATFLAGSNVLRAALICGVVACFALEPEVARLLAGVVASDLLDYVAGALTFTVASGFAALVFSRVGLRTVRPYLPWREVSHSALLSTRSLLFAVVLLFEAWMIGAVCRDLNTAAYLVALMSGAVVPTLLPVLLFAIAGLVAFSTGSSWSTMAILLPNVVGLADSVGAGHAVGGTGMVIVCIGAVLEGSIFGDHCSPISDTTVLSSVSSASDHIDHVRTQAPYALTAAAAALLAGYIPTLLFEWWSFGLSMGIGVGALALTLGVAGRRVG